MDVNLNPSSSGSPNLLKVGDATYIVIPADQEQLSYLGISTLQPSGKQIEKEALTASIPYLAPQVFT